MTFINENAVMSEPKRAGDRPIKMNLPCGEHWWCSCGDSKNQPMCDGSHAGTPFRPLQFACTEAKEVFLCTCKATKNPPYCDGSHKAAVQ
jgi:CDGSH-type Zn-finger protein